MQLMMKKMSAVLVVLALFAGLYPLQNRLTSMKTPDWFKSRMSYLPTNDNVEPMLLGYSSTFANYLWIKTVLYFGEQYEGEKDYRWLTTMVDMVTRLNPYFYPAYEFAGVMLPQESDDVDAAIIILNRGVTYLADERFIIPFYLAWIYNEKRNDPESAAHYMTIAAKHPKAPPFYSGFTASLFAKSDQKELAIKFLMTAYYSSENPAVKETIVDKLEGYDVDVSGFVERAK